MKLLQRSRFAHAAILSLIVGSLFSTVSEVAPGVDNGNVSRMEGASTATMFKIDPAHSSLIFKVRHEGVANFYGRINEPTGTYTIDSANPEASSLTVQIEVANMDAGNEGRNRFLLAPTFFNAREFPTASFVATSFEKTGDNDYRVKGNFTMHGVTKEIVVPLEDYTEKQTARLGYRSGFEVRFKVNRSDYGMDLFVKEGTLGDEVTIIVALEGVKAE